MRFNHQSKQTDTFCHKNGGFVRSVFVFWTQKMDIVLVAATKDI